MDWKSFWNDDPQISEADFCRQVGRTFRGASYTSEQIDALADRLAALLEADAGKTMLDLACGNGLVTSRIAARFGRVTAVDFSCPLIDTARQHFAAANIEYRVGDVTERSVYDRPFDCALVSGALQHLRPSDVDAMLRALATVITPGGRVVLGDVPDRERIWSFYRGIAGRCRYTFDALRGKPIIGTWWTPASLRRLAGRAGWRARIAYQGPENPNHYFRYDAVLEQERTANHG